MSHFTRRHFLSQQAFGLGGLALAWLLKQDGALAVPPKPLLDRFGFVWQLRPYTLLEMSTIIVRSAAKLGVAIDEDGAATIARASRGVPRFCTEGEGPGGPCAFLRATGDCDLDAMRKSANRRGTWLR